MNATESAPIDKSSFLDLDSLVKEFIVDGIQFAVLFGSIARGTNQKTSDIDIGLFTGKNKNNSFKLQLKYSAKFEKMNDKRVDIVILDNASLILAHKVIKDGTLIFENKNFPGSYKRYKEFVISRFPDFHYTIFSQLGK